MRNQLGYSQQKVADDLIITRGRYSKYEDGASEPPLEIMLKMSRYFYVSIDLLISLDLQRIPIREIMELPDNRIMLPVVVNQDDKRQIEIIPHKASMGYLSGYADPEYIESLQTISLPFLGPGKFRAFPVEGDSMPPHKDDSLIVGSYVEQVRQLKKGKGYVFITRNEGITYKKFSGLEEPGVRVSADNTFYEPYVIAYTDILEIWQYAASITLQEFSREDLNLDNQIIISMFKELKEEVRELKKK